MNSPVVSVVVLTWNGRHLMKTCLDALLDQSYPHLEILVVDNASTDGTLEFIRKHYGKRIKTVSLPKNLGYARGNNVGFAAATGDFIATLNNDTRVHPDWIENLVTSAQNAQSAGVFASRQVRMDAPDTLDSVGIGLHRNGEPWNFGGGQKDTGQYDKEMEVFSAHGASAFYRRKTLEQTGFFDEDFIAYHEEFDLCWRIRLQGWRCLYVPRAVLAHQGGATVKRRPGLREYLSSRNRLFCIIKNYPSSVLFEALPDIVKCELWNVYLGTVRKETFRLRARKDAALRIRTLLARRRQIQSRRKMTDAEFRTWLGVAMRAPGT